MSGSLVNPHHRREVTNTCKTLDELTEKPQTASFTLKRSSVYLRLTPPRKDTTEGQRHKKLSNIKLNKDQSMERKKNLNRWFAAATMKHVHDFDVLMGKNNLFITGKGLDSNEDSHC